MAATVDAQATGCGTAPAPEQAADVFVAFGITGDLAKVMTFRSLYRLERRGLLNCPVARRGGRRLVRRAPARARARVASRAPGSRVDDEVFARFAARLSYVQGDFGDAATYARVRRGARRRPAARCSIWRSRRSCSAR